MEVSSSATEQLEQRIRECVACGYFLDGLAADGVCPECGRAYRGDEFRVNGVSGVLVFSALCFGIVLAGYLVLTILIFIRDVRLTVTFFVAILILCTITFGYLGLRSGPNLLLLHDEIRFRHDTRKALMFRWRDVSSVSLRRGPVGWMLTFHVASLAFRPKFHFRADRRRAEALRDFIAHRAREARSR